MIITKTNALFGLAPTSITDPGTDQDDDNITDPDHSKTYSSGVLANNFSVNFSSLTDIEYVAVSGHDACGSGSQATIAVYDVGALVASAAISRNHNTVITFAKRNFTSLRVEFVTAPNTYQITLSYIAAGEYLTVPNSGEQSGYRRNWMARALNQRTSVNSLSSPIATTKRRKPLRGTLNIPNATTLFSRGEWMDFLDFAETQPFFIRENDSLPESAYICFNPNLADAPRAHPSTRGLDALSLKFDAYNGL